MSGVNEERCHQRELAVGWAVHSLEPEEETAFARHLPRCPECTEQVRATERVGEMLARAVPQVDPPDRLREAVLAAARSSTPRARSESVPRPTVAPEPTSPPPASQGSPEVGGSVPALSRTRRVLVAAAAVGVLAFGAGWVGSSVLGAGEGTAVTAGAASAQQVVLRAPDTSDPVAVVLAEGDRASVVPVTLGGAAEGESLWLWGTGDGDPRPLGSMTAGEGGVLSVPAGADAGSFTGYAVSAEPSGPTPDSPTTVIASGAVTA